MPISPKEKNELLTVAREAAASAHCPYSNFHVGAAVLAGGKVFRGCNIENASYGLTVCAERVAIFCAVSSGISRITAIAVACPDAPDSSAENMKMPCGACRQVMAEFGADDLPVLVDRVGEFLLRDLLARPFRLR